MTDQELDRLLYAHAGAARDLVLAQLPPEGELPDIPTSPRFQRRMKALIRRADRPGWAKAALRCARQAAVILLVWVSRMVFPVASSKKMWRLI